MLMRLFCPEVIQRPHVLQGDNVPVNKKTFSNIFLNILQKQHQSRHSTIKTICCQYLLLPWWCQNASRRSQMRPFSQWSSSAGYAVCHCSLWQTAGDHGEGKQMGRKKDQQSSQWLIYLYVMCVKHQSFMAKSEMQVKVPTNVLYSSSLITQVWSKVILTNFLDVLLILIFILKTRVRNCSSKPQT